MALILRANGKREDITPLGENGALTLEQMQEVVGYVQAVKVPYSHNILLVDEEGRLNGKPVNQQASILARQPIVGDSIIVVQEDGEYK